MESDNKGTAAISKGGSVLVFRRRDEPCELMKRYTYVWNPATDNFEPFVWEWDDYRHTTCQEAADFAEERWSGRSTSMRRENV